MLAVAADRARARLYDDRLGRTFQPLPAKRGTAPALFEVMLPDGAPPHWGDRKALWNAAGSREKRRDSALAREAEFGLPAELRLDQGAALARNYVLTAFVADGRAANLNVHAAVRADRQPKPYAQVPLTMRRCGPEGFAATKELAWNEWGNALRWRGLWAEMVNASLAAHGHAARIDHRSHAERGVLLELQNKIRPNAARRARRGEPSEQVTEQQDIARKNEERVARGEA